MKEKTQSQFLAHLLFRIGLAIVVIGCLFIILRGAMGRLIFGIGCGVVITGYFLKVFLKRKRDVLTWIKLLTIICIFSSSFFSALHLPFHPWAYRALHIMALAGLVFIYFKDTKSLIPRSIQHVVSKIFYSLGGITIAMGVLFKIMHWPWAAILLLLGTGSVVIWLLIEPFLPEETVPVRELSDDFTLDEYLTEEKREKRKPQQLKPVFFLAIVLMLFGLAMYLLDYPGAGFTLLAGFLCGGIYVLLGIRF